MTIPTTGSSPRHRPRRLLTVAAVLIAVGAVTAGVLMSTGVLAPLDPQSPGAVTATTTSDSGTQPTHSTADGTEQLDKVGTLIVQRLELADPVAQSKWLSGKAIDDPAREQTVIDDAVARAQQQKIDPALVTRIFRAQIEASKVVQRGLFDQWKQQPATAPTTAPDLTAIRPELDAIGSALVAALGDVASDASAPGCRAAADAERKQSSASLDDLHRSGVDSAWQTFCAD